MVLTLITQMLVVSASAEIVDTQNEVNFSINGLDYYIGMNTVDDLAMLNHTMHITKLAIAGDQVTLEAVFAKDGQEYPLSVTALAYHTEIIPLQKRGGITTIPIESNMEILNFSLVQQA